MSIVVFSSYYSCDSDNDGVVDIATVGFSSSETTVLESSQSTSIIIDFDKPAATKSSFTIRYSGTAEAGVDYTTIPAISKGSIPVSVNKGDTSVEFRINIIDNKKDNENKTIRFSIVGLTEALQVTDSGVYKITIQDDDEVPVAAFNADKRIVEQGDEVRFTDVSTGEAITTWEWVFEGGTPNKSSDQNPKVVYDTKGKYKVTLVVRNEVGASDPEIKTEYITVTGPAVQPIADFSIDELITYNVNQAVAFTDTSLNEPVTWSWQFPGGTPATSTEANPVVTYTAAGTYDVTLTVTNAAGTSDPVTKVGFVNINPSGTPIEKRILVQADAWNRASQSDRNRGTASSLQLDGVLEGAADASNQREIFLKFDISSVDVAQITSANLVMTTVPSSFDTSGQKTNQHVFYIADDSWQESTIVPDNQPSTPQSSIASVFAGNESSEHVFDITSQIQSETDGVLSLQLRTDAANIGGGGNNRLFYESKETSNALGTKVWPQLVLKLNP